MTPSLKAAPNRVILRFPPTKKETNAGIIIPETSQLRPEFGEILDVGEAVGDEAIACRRFLLEMQKAGKRIPVSVASGVSYWRQTYESNKTEEWLAEIRVYRLTEIGAALESHPMYNTKTIITCDVHGCQDVIAEPGALIPRCCNKAVMSQQS
jgi:co-chaperonin GroES (HSP10)